MSALEGDETKGEAWVVDESTATEGDGKGGPIFVGWTGS